MNAVELRELSTEELVDALRDAKEERFNLRFQIATNQLDNTTRLKVVKKNIARILTVMRERELSLVSDEAGAPAATGGEESV